MLAECISNSTKILPSNLLSPALGLSVDSRFNVTVGKTYVVLGLGVFEGFSWYLIADDTYTYYPVWIPADFFKITSGAIPDIWIADWKPAAEGRGARLTITFPQWTSIPYFYDSLTDGDEEAVAIFASYKSKLDSLGC